MLEIPLHFANATNPQTATVILTGISGGTIQISYFPAAYYRSIGTQDPGTVLLFTPLSRAVDLIRQEPDLLPPTESLTVAQQSWTDARAAGAVPPTTAPEDEQIRELFVQFKDLNDPAVGTLCPESMNGIGTYKAMASHDCFVWCSGYARILRGFLRSSGVPARYVTLSAAVKVLPNGVLVQSSEGHATVEMWSGGRWHWVDPTFRVLRATAADGQELSISGLIKALTDPVIRENLLFTRLDPTTGSWRTEAYSSVDQHFRDNLARYMSADKTIVVPNDGRG